MGLAALRRAADDNLEMVAKAEDLVQTYLKKELEPNVATGEGPRGTVTSFLITVSMPVLISTTR